MTLSQIKTIKKYKNKLYTGALKEKRRTDMKIFLKKTIIQNMELSHKAICAYIALCSICNITKETEYITAEALCYSLCGQVSYSKHLKYAMTAAVEELIDLGIIEAEEIEGGKYIVNSQNLKATEEYFIIIYQEEVHKIFSIGYKGKYSLLRYFVSVIGTINAAAEVRVSGNKHNNFVGFMPIDYLAKISNISPTSAVKYNELLEKNELMYIYRSKMYDTSNGQIKTVPNCYGRVIDKECIERYARIQENRRESKAKSKADAKYKRSMYQKYRAFIGGTVYSKAEMLRLKAFIYNENEKNRKIIAESSNAKEVERIKAMIKDESVFDNIVFSDKKADVQKVKVENQEYRIPKCNTVPVRYKPKQVQQRPISRCVADKVDTMIERLHLSDTEIIEAVQQEIPKATVEMIEREIHVARNILKLG